jgi:peptide chain release factor subunit 1
MEIEGRKDIVKELHEVAGRYDSNVELISMDSDEGKMLMTAFGGIAAILRFRIT